MKTTIIILLSVIISHVGFGQGLTLANVGGQYRAAEGVKGYDRTEYPTLECKPLDKGDDPLFSRVQVAFTFFWVGHKDAIGLKGAGIGSITKEGSLSFSFVDEDGRHGTGVLQPQEKEYTVTLKTSDKIAHDQHDLDKTRSIYNRTFTFVRGK